MNRWQIGNINQGGIHADPTTYRCPPTTNQNLRPVGKLSQVAISISNRQYCNPALATGHKGMSIADAASWTHFFYLDYPTLETHYRL